MNQKNKGRIRGNEVGVTLLQQEALKSTTDSFKLVSFTVVETSFTDARMCDWTYQEVTSLIFQYQFG
jgi:hypothetical protein